MVLIMYKLYTPYIVGKKVNGGVYQNSVIYLLNIIF